MKLLNVAVRQKGISLAVKWRLTIQTKHFYSNNKEKIINTEQKTSLRSSKEYHRLSHPK